MKKSLMNSINLAIGFIGSVISIITFIGSHLGIKLPKIEIDLDYLYSRYGEYVFIVFFSIFILALCNVIFRNKKYEKCNKKYNEVIHYFQDIIINNRKVNYKELAELIIDMYPHKNKSKINLVIGWNSKSSREKKLIYDTANYDEWRNNRHILLWLSRKLKNVNLEIMALELQLKHDNWRKAYKLRQRTTFYLSIGEENNIAYLYLYGSKRAFTRRKKKIMGSYSHTIEKFLYIILCSDEMNF